MLQKLDRCLSGIRMTLLSGVFLGASLALLLSGRQSAADPALVTVLLSGYPIVYAALTNLLQERQITSELLVSLAIAAALAAGEIFAAGEVAFIMALGEILETMTVARAK